MSNENIKLVDVVKICSRAKLKDGSMTFDSFGSNEVRIDTMEFLYSIGKTLEDAEGVVNSIAVDDYYEGPLDHYDNNRNKHQLWVFKKQGFGLMLYIKIIPFNKNRYVAVVSFHEDRN